MLLSPGWERRDGESRPSPFHALQAPSPPARAVSPRRPKQRSSTCESDLQALVFEVELAQYRSDGLVGDGACVALADDFLALGVEHFAEHALPGDRAGVEVFVFVVVLAGALG